MTQKSECGAILIVEDNEDLLDTFKSLLEMEGFKITTANNGKEALDALEVIQNPCLILLDMFMPIMNGWEFLDHLKIKNENLIQTLPIIICSASGEKAIESAAKTVRGFIQKPVDLDVLVGIAKKHCGGPKQGGRSI